MAAADSSRADDGPRACRVEELAAVVELSNHVMAGAYGGEPWYGHTFAFAYHPDNLENIRIIRRDGRVAASATLYPSRLAVAGREINVGGISTVVTHPQFRGQGLAVRLMEDCQAKMRADGIDVGHLSTPIPDFYRPLGWEHAGTERTYPLDRASATLLPELPGHRVVTCTPDTHLPELAEIYRTAPFAVRRTDEDFRLKIFARWANRVLAAVRRGRTAAYLVVSGCSVIEHAGEPVLVAGLLGRVYRDWLAGRAADTRTDPKLRRGWTVVCPPHGDGLAELLDGFGFPATTGYLGMLHVPDPVRLAAKLVGDSVVLRPAGGGIEIVHGRQRTFVARAMVPKMFFGPERCLAMPVPDLPVELFLWPPDRV